MKNIRYFITIMTILLAFSVTAACESVVRELPDTPVGPGEGITVRLTQEGFFANVVKVTEVLPEGFEYISGSYTGTRGDTPSVYYPGNNTLVMYLAGEDDIGEDDITETYTVTAGTFEQIDNAVFIGVYQGFSTTGTKTGDVTGNSALEAVEQPTDDGSDDGDIPAPSPTPTATEVIETPTPVEAETATSVETPTADETPTVTETAIETATAPAAAKTPKQPKGGIPGFEGVFAIAGLMALVLIMRRGRNS